jgi:GAF domain-containing protein
MSPHKDALKTSQDTQTRQSRRLAFFLGPVRDRLQDIIGRMSSRETLENVQLLEAVERRAVQLDTLNQVSRILNQTLELDAVLQLIMEKSLELLDAEAGSLMLADNDEEALTFEVVLSPVGNQLRGEKVAINSSSIVGSVALERQGLIVKDVQADPRWDISFDQTTGFHTRNLICVPMISRDRLVGVIELLNKRSPTCFSEEDTELLSGFAAQAAIAIENARLFTMTDQALTERVQELNTMQLIDRQLNATLDLTRVMDLTLEHAMDAVDASTGVMGVMNEEGTGLYLVTPQSTPTEFSRYQD